MKSVRLQLLVTVAATLLACGILIAKGPPPTRDIMDAAEDGDMDQLRRLFNWGANPNVTDWEGITPLHYALSDDAIDMATLLLDNGADIRGRGRKYDDPPLIEVIQFDGNHEIIQTVRLLVDRGADVNVRNYCGETPLHRAALVNRKDIGELLIAHGAKLDARTDNEGCTPLDYAIEEGNEDFANFLRAHGAKEQREQKCKTTSPKS